MLYVEKEAIKMQRENKGKKTKVLSEKMIKLNYK
jgi:hypothetical protein